MLTDWDHFVLRHSKAGNLLLHGLAVTVFVLALAAMMLTGRPLWLAVIPIAILIGNVGHGIFKDNGDEYGLYSDRISFRKLGYLAVALVMWFTGAYAREVAAATRKAVGVTRQ